MGASFTSRTLLPLLALGGTLSAVSWGAFAAQLAKLLPPEEPAWLALALPAYAVLAIVPMRLVGAPRWATNPLACSQEPWLPVVHIARLGSDLWVTASLGAAAVVGALGWRLLWTATHGEGEKLVSLGSILAMGASLLAALAALGYGRSRYRKRCRRLDEQTALRVAAVVCDGVPPEDKLDGMWPLHSPEYTNVSATIARYTSQIRRAAHNGAKLVVLPEVAVRVGPETRVEWLQAVQQWAKSFQITLVAPFFDESRPSNELVVVGPKGEVLTQYEKQHPSPLEPKPFQRMCPGRASLGSDGSCNLSTVICVDLDYGDLVKPVAQRGGLLAVPANDWPDLARLHHRTAVWAAVMSGVSLIRATGHGVSAGYDAAGRVVSQQWAALDPVVLVVDLPL